MSKAVKVLIIVLVCIFGVIILAAGAFFCLCYVLQCNLRYNPIIMRKQLPKCRFNKNTLPKEVLRYLRLFTAPKTNKSGSSRHWYPMEMKKSDIS